MYGNCRGCGTLLNGQRRGNRRLWCSEACRVAAHRRNQRGPRESRSCKHCSSPFDTSRTRHVFCSQACREKHRQQRKRKGPRQLRLIPCMACGVPVMSIGVRTHCADCRKTHQAAINRRKNSKRKGASIGIHYTVNEIGDRDGWRCHLCRRKINRTLPGTDELGPTIDHLIPVAHGGVDERENVAIAHRSCNVKRQDRGAVQLRLVG
jgi:hypothetical protein